MENNNNSIMSIDSFAIKNLQTGEIIRKRGSVYTFNNPTSAKEQDGKKEVFNIFYNSFDKTLSIRYNNTDDNRKDVHIYDIKGNCIYSNKLYLGNNQEQIINMNSFPLGVYVVVINSGRDIYTQKFMTTQNIFYSPSLVSTKYEIIAYKISAMPDTIYYKLDETKPNDTLTFTGRLNPRWKDYEVVLEIDNILVEHYYSFRSYIFPKEDTIYTDTIIYNYSEIYNKNNYNDLEPIEVYNPYRFLEPNLISFAAIFLKNDRYCDEKSSISCYINLDEKNEVFSQVEIDKYSKSIISYSGWEVDTKRFYLLLKNMPYQKEGDDYIAYLEGIDLVPAFIQLFTENVATGSLGGGYSSDDKINKVVKILQSSKITITVRKKK